MLFLFKHVNVQQCNTKRELLERPHLSIDCLKRHQDHPRLPQSKKIQNVEFSLYNIQQTYTFHMFTCPNQGRDWALPSLSDFLSWKQFFWKFKMITSQLCQLLLFCCIKERRGTFKKWAGRNGQNKRLEREMTLQIKEEGEATWNLETEKTSFVKFNY